MFAMCYTRKIGFSFQLLSQLRCSVQAILGRIQIIQRIFAKLQLAKQLPANRIWSPALPLEHSKGFQNGMVP